MQCKNFDKANLDECVSLYIDVFSKEPWYEQNRIEKIKEYFLMLLEMNTFLGFMLVKDSQIIGLCLGYIKPYIFDDKVAKEYAIDQFFIAYNYQSKGYGKQFLESIKMQLKMQYVDINAMILNTQRKYPAFRFYKRCGFEALDEYAILACDIKAN